MEELKPIQFRSDVECKKQLSVTEMIQSRDKIVAPLLQAETIQSSDKVVTPLLEAETIQSSDKIVAPLLEANDKITAPLLQAETIQLTIPSDITQSSIFNYNSEGDNITVGTYTFSTDIMTIKRISSKMLLNIEFTEIRTLSDGRPKLVHLVNTYMHVGQTAPDENLIPFYVYYTNSDGLDTANFHQCYGIVDIKIENNMWKIQCHIKAADPAVNGQWSGVQYVATLTPIFITVDQTG